MTHEKSNTEYRKKKQKQTKSNIINGFLFVSVNENILTKIKTDREEQKNQQ